MTNHEAVTFTAAQVEDLRLRTRAFIRDIVIPAEPRPGHHLDPAIRAELMTKAKSSGVFAPHVSREFGGQGLPIEHWPVIFEEAGYSPIGPSVLNCMAPDEGNMHMLGIIATDAQKQQYLAPLAAGEVRSSFAMTEPHPGAGSDPDALTTSAEFVDGKWVINGDKRFISGGLVASFFIVMARTPETGSAPAGATMFLVDSDNPGVRIGRSIPTIDRVIDGGHPYVHFENCAVEESAVLGAPGEGFRYAQVRLGPARLTHCMRWLGLARRANDVALDRASRRQLFGHLQGDLGLAQELLAQNIVDIETSSAIIARTARLLADDPKAGSAMSSIAKVHTGDAIFRVIDRSMQLCGGDGMSDDLPLASYLNEVRPFRVYDGSTETHKWAIARRALKARQREVAAGAQILDAVPASE